MSLEQVWTTTKNIHDFDSFDNDKECDPSLIFHRMGRGKEQPPPSKHLPMGRIGRRQTRLRHCNSARRHWWRFIPDFLRDVAKRKGSNI